MKPIRVFASVCLPALFIGAAFAHAATDLRVAIVETQDTYTKATGLSEFLKAEKVAFTDLSGDFENGRVPDLSNADLLIVGSFITNNPNKRATYQAAGDSLREMVARGGVVVVLCQADQDQGTETWMAPPRRITRADPDAGTAYPTQPDHPLLKAAEPLESADLTGWRVPTSWPAVNTVWEAFSAWEEAAIVLGTNESASPSTAGLIEMGWGKGRAVFAAMAADKAFAVGNDAARRGGTKLLRNLLAYTAMVRGGNAPEIKITLPPGYRHAIQGEVYADKNGNGRRDQAEPGVGGIAVSDGLEVVVTDASGAYRLDNPGKNAVFVFVHQGDGIKQKGQDFYHLLANDVPADARFDFGLQPAEETEGSDAGGVRFVQLTDSHIRSVSDREYMQQATAEIYAMKPAPDFVVATGDLVDWGVDEHFQNYVAGMTRGDGSAEGARPPVTYYNVFGNHELVFGPIERYHQYIGPDYYSFERKGILFLALNCVTRTERQEAWVKRTLELLGRGRPVVAFQHYPPSLDELERFSKMGVKSVFSGHWHSEKEMEYASVQSINSPNFIMGGIDASPAGFKVVHMAADGSAETEWRYGFQNQRLTIVSPQYGMPVNDSYFPILVNAYDTSRDVVSVKWRIGRDDDSLSLGNLRRDSALGWSGVHRDKKLPTGSHPLHVEARDDQGATWTASGQFDTQPGRAVPPAPQGEWPMFMGSAAHSGVAATSIDSLPLRLAWAVDTGGDPDFASPILADGRLYLALKKRTRGRTNGVAAFDPVSGDRLWLFETPMAINHTAAFAEGVLCVAEMGGRIYGVEAATGQERWHHDLIDSRGRYSYCAPAVHEGRFYAGVMRRLARLQPADGHVDWEKQIGGADNDWISSYGSPAASGEFLVMTGMFGSGDAVVVVRTKDGTKVNGHPGGMLASATIAGNDVLFCDVGSTLYCMPLEDGGVKWKTPLGAPGGDANWSATTPAVKMNADGSGVIVAGSGDGRMSGVDLADGRVLWTHTCDPGVFKVSPYRRDDRPLLSSPTIAGDKVFFASADGHLYCLDLASGEQLWSFVVGAPVMSTPLVTGNAVYVAAYDGRLYAFTSGQSANREAAPASESRN